MTAQPAAKLDLDHLRQWIGRSEEKTDIVTAHLARGLRATLFMEIGEPKPGDAAPFTAHWCLAQPVYPMSQLGPDGHPTRGGFLPPVPLPRRMWAGGELEFVEPLRVGDEMTRRSRISDVTMKTGSTGALCFVSVQHEISSPRGLAIRERQDIVYRDVAPAGQNTAPAKPAAPLPAAKHRESHIADEVLLFRYSALTFNGHRIHYDRRYVTGVEGYPGLIVPGPLLATLLLDLLRHKMPDARVSNYQFRAIRPTFDINPFHVCGEPLPDGKTFHLWARDHEGWLTMDATAVLASE